MISNMDMDMVMMINMANREAMEYSAKFSTRLCLEKCLRISFLDFQTGVAQNHS